VKKIKKLQTKYLNKIEYFGIEYRANGDTMKLISQELGGTNSISYQAAALTETYIEIIDRNWSNALNSGRNIYNINVIII